MSTTRPPAAELQTLDSDVDTFLFIADSASPPHLQHTFEFLERCIKRISIDEYVCASYETTFSAVYPSLKRRFSSGMIPRRDSSEARFDAYLRANAQRVCITTKIDQWRTGGGVGGAQMDGIGVDRPALNAGLVSAFEATFNEPNSPSTQLRRALLACTIFFTLAHELTYPWFRHLFSNVLDSGLMKVAEWESISRKEGRHLEDLLICGCLYAMGTSGDACNADRFESLWFQSQTPRNAPFQKIEDDTIIAFYDFLVNPQPNISLEQAIDALRPSAESVLTKQEADERKLVLQCIGGELSAPATEPIDTTAAEVFGGMVLVPLGCGVHTSQVFK
ncbi:hypothetical protein MKEN_01239300 [Mycena kentingensis (nom. inval.)]|nr:hypothetical protein MKEN_01239300 [Mycena kentingensis (nom. inval.)]